MGIKEIFVNGEKTFEVSVHIRSSLNRKIRIQKRKTGILSLKEAQTAEKKLIQSCSLEVARLEGSGLPWEDLLEKYELGNRKGTIVQNIQLSTLWDNLSTLRRFTSSWNKKLCSEILPGDVRRVFEAMQAENYSKTRIRTLKGAINAVFKWGIEEGAIVGIRTSPADSIFVGKSNDEKPPDILNLEEIQKLLSKAEELEHDWHPIWRVALLTGMRSGELFALSWSDIDFEMRMISCSKSFNKRLNKFKSTKGGYWRKIPMNDELLNFLASLHHGEAKLEDFVLPRIEMWRRGEQAKVLKEFCEAIGIKPVKFHALRACFATHLLNSGIESPKVKKICGWTDEKVMGRYIRLAGIDVKGATDQIGLDFVRGGQNEIRTEESSFRNAKRIKPNL